MWLEITKESMKHFSWEILKTENMNLKVKSSEVWIMPFLSMVW
jgi:hypothetical protein